MQISLKPSKNPGCGQHNPHVGGHGLHDDRGNLLPGLSHDFPNPIQIVVADRYGVPHNFFGYARSPGMPKVINPDPDLTRSESACP